MSRYKRILTIALLLLIVVSIKPTSTYSSESTCKDNLERSSLIKQLVNDNPKIRLNSIHALLAAGTDAMPCLNEGLTDENEEIACASANVIAELGSSGIDSFISFLKDDRYNFLNSPRINCVLDGLYRIGPEIIPPILELCVSNEDDYHPLTFNEFIKLIQKFKNSATPYLIKATQATNPKLQHLALRIQKEIRDESFIPNAVALLNSDNYAVKIEAAWTLGFLGQNAKTALPPLINILNTADEEVRAHKVPFVWFGYSSLKNELLQVIIKIDNEREIAFTDIFKLTDDNDPEVRKLSITYLNNANKNTDLIFKRICDLTNDPQHNGTSRSSKVSKID